MKTRKDLPRSIPRPFDDDGARSSGRDESSVSEDSELDAFVRALAFAPPKGPPVLVCAGAGWGDSGRYVVREALGRGGMGTVYAARDTLLGRDVALKVLDAVDEDDRARLLREAQLAAGFEHERIARVYDVGAHDGVAFVSMEYVRGVTLRRRMQERVATPSEVAAVGTQIAEGLAELHAHGVVHRDLKPENVMLTAQGDVKLLDFGLARRASRPASDDPRDPRDPRDERPSAARLSGTPGYMAPERYMGESLHPRIDVFALGVILYELVRRERPFCGVGVLAIGATREDAAALFAGEAWACVPARLREAIGRMLARDPAARVEDGKAALDALRGASGRAGSAGRPGSAETSTRGARDASPKPGEAHDARTGHAPTRRSVDLSGTQLGGFHLIRRIGVGSVGSVYEGLDASCSSSAKRPLAIKVLHVDLAREEIDRLRKRELRAAKMLQHPHVVEVFDFIADPGHPPCIVMELLHGETLHDLLKRRRRVTPRRAVRFALQALSALEAAHDKEILHRAIKPANIFLAEQEGAADHAKMLDFGSSKLLSEATGMPLTVTGMVIEALSFMPPEQALARRIDARVDLYSLAATLYAAISGRPPFAAATPADILRAVRREEPRPLRSAGVEGVDPALDAILRKGLQKDPAARFQTAGEMARALRAWLAQVPPETKPSPSRTTPLGAPPREVTPRRPMSAALLRPDGDGRHHTLDGVTLADLEGAPSPQPVAPSVDLVMPAVGGAFGRYRIQGLLGAGGVSEVFRAADTEIERSVALKVLHVARRESETGVTAVAAERILHEARLAATIDHPNAVSIFDVDTRGGLPYLVMELIDGRSFRDVVRDPFVPIARKIAWLDQIARALSAAHDKGIVHRDIKPENVMLREADQAVKVLDFGIAERMFEKARAARDEATAHISGTPAYMAPEQMRGEEATARSDQFAWGVFAYELLTGTLPWVQRGGMLHLVHQILTRVPEPPSRSRPEVPPEIDRVIFRALAKKPEERYASMGAVSAALLKGWTASTTARRPSRWRRGLVVAAAAAAVAGGLLLPRSRPPARGATVASAPIASAPIEPAAPDYGSTMSSNAEAVAAYRAGVEATRNAAAGAARASLERATTLDPSFAAAHLRKVLATPWVDEVERVDVIKAKQLRDALGEHDRALLRAIEPWVAAPQDVHEVVRRLTALTERHPDADYLAQLCRFRVLAGSYADALEACRAAEMLDPRSAHIAWLEGQSRLFSGATAAGRRDAEACVRLSPAPTSCLNDLFHLEEHAGAAGAAFGYASRLVELEPDNAIWLEQLGTAGYAVGQPMAEVRAAYERSYEWSPIEQVPQRRARTNADLAILSGDFEEARRQLDAWERALDGVTDEESHADLFEARTLFHREVGFDAASAAQAHAILSKLAAWSPNMEGDRSIDALIALYRGGALPRREFVAARAAWLERDRARPRPSALWGAIAGRRWITAYADAVVTKEDAEEALAVLLEYQPLPSDRVRSTSDDEAIGMVFWTAGRVQEAIPYLRRAASSCDAVQFPWHHTWANLELGRALESSDVSGACAAYRVVVDRWAGAPRSSSARRAQERRRALGCR